MKRLFLSLAVIAAALTACNQIDNPAVEEDEGGHLYVELRGAPVVTKADVTPLPSEVLLKDTQVFVFNDDEEKTLYRKETVTGDQKTIDIPHVKAGNYTVVAVSNYGSLSSDDAAGNLSPRNRADLDAAVITLGMCDPTNCFVMYGATDGVVTVNANSGSSSSTTASATKAPITLQRFAVRVRLVEVENKIPTAYGDLRLDYMFLANAYGTWVLNPAASSPAAKPTEPVNWGGRLKGRSADQVSRTNVQAAIRSASDAMYYNSTFSALGLRVPQTQTLKVEQPLYSLPNPTERSQDNFNGALQETTPACLRLVLHATFDANPDKSFYYPVTIIGTGDTPVVRNTTYDVRMTIRGEGVFDPNEEPKYGNMSVEVTVEPWSDGGDIPKEF